MSSLPVAFTPAARINHSLTANAERQLLTHIATRLPRWVTSDQLTALGFLAQIAAGIFYAFTRYNRFALIAVILCLILNWFGDSLDGTLARIRHQQRPRFGFYVDHIIDLFGAIALMSGLAASGIIHPQVPIVLLISFMLLAAESFLATYTLSRFQLSTGIFGPTEIRLFLILGNLAALHSPTCTILHHKLLLFDIGGTIGAISMFTIAIALIIRHTTQLYKEELLA